MLEKRSTFTRHFGNISRQKRWQNVFCCIPRSYRPREGSVRLHVTYVSTALSTEPLSSAKASLCRKEAERKKKKTRRARWEGKRERRKASSHRSPRAFCFSIITFFYWDIQREPLRRRELLSTTNSAVFHQSRLHYNLSAEGAHNPKRPTPILGLCQPRPQGAFPWLWRWGPPPKPGKSTLGTRLGLSHGVFTDQFIFRHILGHFFPRK